jgi:hypothetical protein
LFVGDPLSIAGGSLGLSALALLDAGTALIHTDVPLSLAVLRLSF